MSLVNVSPIINQYLNIKKKYKNILLFYQIGDFYELFYEDAKKISSLLNLHLTIKKFVKHENVPMAGIPIRSYKKYIIKLINLGESVVICNQINDFKDNSKLKERRVIKIITPGTISESNFLNSKNDNFIASIWKVNSNNFGYSLIDIFSGKFYVLELNNLNDIKTELLKTNPSEIVYFKDNFDISLVSNNFKIFNSLYDKKFCYKKYLNILLDHFKLSNLDCFNIKIDNLAIIISAGFLLNYIKFTQLIDLLHINKIELLNNIKYLFIDYYTIKNLEIINSLNNNNKNTLLYVLDTTLTPMGGRLLKRWLVRPLNDLNIIKNRHLIMDFIWTKNDDLRKLFKNIGDLERIIGRICLKNVSSKNLISLKYYFKSILKILKLFNNKELLNYEIFNFLLNKKKLMDNIINLIKISIVNPKKDLNNLILNGYNSKLDKLKKFCLNSDEYIMFLETQERKKTNINNLFIRYNKFYGYFIQISKSDLKFIPNYYIKYQSLKNYERYYFSDLKKFELKLFNIKRKIFFLEKKIFDEILNKIIFYIKDLKLLSDYISELDVLSCFVERSVTLNYNKPIFLNYSYLNIKNGRHPILENVLHSKFITNDILINDNIRTLLITGPNMGGKSTYMRQIALICIMAYIGCYVSASEAYIGFIDKILTRIGFSDDIISNKSTFMIEMSEMSYIINNSTNNSLVLIDEMGRGTSFYEGVSLAWSCLNYISKKIKCITLFSTHFYELINIGNFYKNIKKIYFNYIKKKNNIIFLYKIKDGVCDNSLSFWVAYKSNIPKIIIDISYFIFKKFKFCFKNNKNNLNFYKDYINILNIIKKINFNLSVKEFFNNIKYIKNFYKNIKK